MRLHWHRRDCRVRGVVSLSRAADAGPIAHVFVFDPADAVPYLAADFGAVSVTRGRGRRGQ